MILESKQHWSSGPEEVEQLSSEEEIIQDLERIGAELEERLAIFVKAEKDTLFGSKGVWKEGMHRPKGKERSLLLKEARDALIGQYSQYAEFITALTEAFDPGSEWRQLMTHLLLAKRNEFKVMQKFWEVMRKLNPFGHALTFSDMKRGILSQATAVQVFEGLGFPVRLATPAEDASNANRPGIDFFAGNIAVQVKSKSGKVELITLPHGVVSRPDNLSFLQVNISKAAANRYTGMPTHQLFEAARNAFSKAGIEIPAVSPSDQHSSYPDDERRDRVA